MALVLLPAYTYAEMNVGTDITGGVKFETTGKSTSSSSTVEVDLGAEQDTDVDSEMNNEVNSETSLKINADGVAVNTSSEVQNDSDLEVFASNVASSEEKVGKVSFDSEASGAWETEVIYQHEGKLFGLFPITILSTTKIKVDEDGKLHVDSDMPWWNFLVASKNHAEAEIESRLRDNATVMVGAKVDANAKTKAEVAEAVVSELNVHTFVQTSATSE